MHDLDRTSFEMNDEAFQDGEFEFESELPGGTFDRPFSEAELDELALELLQVRDEYELDQFLGSLIEQSGAAPLESSSRSPAGAALKGILKNAISSAVPVLGGVVELADSGRRRWHRRRRAIKSELECEGVPTENRDVEAAKKVIEVGGVAAQQVAAMPPNAPPQAAVDAVQSAAQQQGVATGGGSRATSSERRHGRLRCHQRPVVSPRSHDRDRWTLSMNTTAALAGWLLDQEARALLTRLDRVRPFVLFETMVPAAAPLASASAAIHEYLARMAKRLRQYGVRLPVVAPQAARARHACRAHATAVHPDSTAVQRDDVAVRHLRRRDDATQRTRDGRLALRPRPRLLPTR